MMGTSPMMRSRVVWLPLFLLRWKGRRGTSKGTPTERQVVARPE